MPRALPCLILVLTSLSGAAQGPSGRLVVLNKEDATLVTVDPASGRVLGRVPTGEAPHEVAVSADGRTAVVGNYGAQTPGSTISVIDLTAMKELHRVDVSPLRRPHGVFFNGGSVYFTSETNRILARYDVASNRIDWLFGTGQSGTHMVWANADASKMYACNIGSDSIAMVDLKTLAVTGRIETGRGPDGMAWAR